MITKTPDESISTNKIDMIAIQCMEEVADEFQLEMKNIIDN